MLVLSIGLSIKHSSSHSGATADVAIFWADKIKHEEQIQKFVNSEDISETGEIVNIFFICGLCYWTKDSLVSEVVSVQ